MSAWGRYMMSFLPANLNLFYWKTPALDNNSLLFHCHPIKLEAFILLFQYLCISSGGKKHEKDSFHSIAGRE